MTCLLVAKNEFKRSLKNKKKLILTLLLPLISIIIAIGINTLMKPSINIGIIKNQYTNKIIEEKFDNVDRVKTASANEKTINTDMILAKYIGVVEFEENNKFKIYSLDKNIKSMLESSISETITTGKTKKIENILGTLEKGNLSAAQRSNGFIFITLIITCTMSATILLKDKEEGILKRYLSTPHKLSSYILGNYIYNTLNTITQVLISTLVLYLLKIDMGISIGQFIFVGIIISIIASSTATLITIISKSELQASLLASAIALIMALFGGAFLPIEKMPVAFKHISNLSITKWIIELTSVIEKRVVCGDDLIIIGLILLASVSIVFISINIAEQKFI